MGLMETLLTAKLVDEITNTRSHKNRESWALGVANIAAGFLRRHRRLRDDRPDVVNVKIGRARTRVSTIVAGLFLLALITGLSSILKQIPMVALAAVMMVVAISTVNWHSVKPATLKRMPIPETLVMVVTVAVVVATSNLAIGVIVGVVLAMVLFARRVAHVITVRRTVSADATAVRYEVMGPLFFGSSNNLVDQFEYADDPASVTIDLSQAAIWDASSVAALDSIETKFRDQGATVTIEGPRRAQHRLPPATHRPPRSLSNCEALLLAGEIGPEVVRDTSTMLFCLWVSRRPRGSIDSTQSCSRTERPTASTNPSPRLPTVQSGLSPFIAIWKANSFASRRPNSSS